VWPGELPPDWELEWVDDDVSFSYLPLFSLNSEPFTSMSKNYVYNNEPYGDVMDNL
jgi:hypothetical protein